MRRHILVFSGLVLALAAVGADVAAQTPARDPSDRLREVLPSNVANRVLARIAAARSRGLPEQALENRALKFAARGVSAGDIERSVTDHIARMEHARTAIDTVRRGRHADAGEIEAGAEAIRHGVDGAKVSELASSAPSGRSLAVPLFVIGSLVDRGLPSDAALQRVLARMQQRASDRDLEQLPGDVATRGRPDDAGRGAAGDRGPPPHAGGPGRGVGGAGGPPGGRPANVPANPGPRGRPGNPGRKPHP